MMVVILALVLAVAVVWFFVWLLSGSDAEEHNVSDDVVWGDEWGKYGTKAVRFKRRDPSLPAICADRFTGKVEIEGEAVRFINGVRVSRR